MPPRRSSLAYLATSLLLASRVRVHATPPGGEPPGAPGAGSAAAPAAAPPPPEVLASVCPFDESDARSIGVVVHIPGAPASMGEAEVFPRRFGVGPCRGGRLFYMTHYLPPPGWTEEMRCVDPEGATVATFTLRVVEGTAELCNPP